VNVISVCYLCTGNWCGVNVISVCYLCTGNWCMFIVFVMCQNTHITLLYILPVDCHILVSLRYTVLVIKSQSVKKFMYNYSVNYASNMAALEVQVLALWKIVNLWLIATRQERHFLTTRSLIVACISAEATTSSQTCWSQQNISVLPVICENQQC
jgi:hypothetical protein